MGSLEVTEQRNWRSIVTQGKNCKRKDSQTERLEQYTLITETEEKAEEQRRINLSKEPKAREQN